MARKPIPKPEVSIKWRKGEDPKKLLDNISIFEKDTIKQVSYMIFDAADSLINNIVKSWSGHYPPASSPGFPPAIRSENLNDTVENSKGYARDVYGRFAERGKATTIVITIDTSRGGGERRMHSNKENREYAYFLEEGTSNHAPRPFIVPAVEKVKNEFPKLAHKIKVNIESRRYV